jgi:hypothetical protein
VPELPEHLRGHLTDSAGQPWAGRSFSENQWSNDDGTAPEALAQALEDFRTRRVPVTAVVDALRDTRLLIPLVAELGEEGENEAGVKVDKQADLSIVTVRAPDGRGIVPMFTSVAAMQAWNAEARPVPVGSRQAALAVVDEGSELIILDPGSETETAIRRPGVWAIARDVPYELPWQDERVIGFANAVLAANPELVSVDLVPGDVESRLAGPEVRLGLVFPHDVDETTVQGVIARVQASVAERPELVECVDTLELTPLRAAATPAPEDSIPSADTRPPKAGLFRRLRRR